MQNWFRIWDSNVFTATQIVKWLYMQQEEIECYNDSYTGEHIFCMHFVAQEDKMKIFVSPLPQTDLRKTYGEHHILLSIVQSFPEEDCWHTMHHILYEEIQYIEQQK